MANTRREDRQRAAVLHLVHRGRHGIRHVSRILGVPKSTVSDWVRAGATGIRNPRLRQVAQTAIDQHSMQSSDQRWRTLAETIAEEGGAAEVALLRAAEGGEGADNIGADDTPTGVMVAFFLPAEVAQALALDPEEVEGEVEPPEELHLTLAYLGQADQVADPERLKRVVAGFAAIAPPVQGEVSGVGRFATGERPVYASFDAPALPDWRQRLVQHLRMAGYPPDAAHGYTPHITLAYPEGKVNLDVTPLTVGFTTVTLALAGDRYDWPLEGTAALFAEAPPADQTDRPATPPTPPSDREPAAIANQVPNTGGGADLAPAMVLQDDAPPIMDRLWVEAFTRWADAIRNGVPHRRALEAAQMIDDDFNITDAQARRAFHHLGLAVEPVLFADPAEVFMAQAGRAAPPDYVKSVYEQYRYSPEQQQEMADYLYGLAREAYLEGINDQLVQLGRPIVTGVTDPVVLEQLREQATMTAHGITDTYDRDLAGETYQQWVDLRAERGTQMSRYWLEQAMADWGATRAEWKAEQIAISEVGRWWTRATQDFAARNQDRGLRVREAYVTPYDAQCAACKQLVAGNPYSPEEAAALPVPLHPHCVHGITYVYEDAPLTSPLWSGQLEEAA